MLSRVQARLMLCVGLVAVGAGMLLMGGIQADDDWTGLLAGFLVAGAGVGLINPVIADVAVSVVPKEKSGMAAGINDTFRQVGIAVGIAVWGRSSSAGAPTRSANSPRARRPRRAPTRAN